ncbi:MAG: hypothetical protein LBR52_05595 [Prevotellaceae bacterium]|nr:hypothetical protein [Prevotellaceae bacterium]
MMQKLQQVVSDFYFKKMEDMFHNLPDTVQMKIVLDTNCLLGAVPPKSEYHVILTSVQ